MCTLCCTYNIGNWDYECAISACSCLLCKHTRVPFRCCKNCLADCCCDPDGSECCREIVVRCCCCCCRYYPAIQYHESIPTCNTNKVIEDQRFTHTCVYNNYRSMENG